MDSLSFSLLLWHLTLMQVLHLRGLHHPTCCLALLAFLALLQRPSFAGPLSLFVLLALLLPYYHCAHAPCPCHPPSLPVHAPCPCHLPSLPGRPLIRLLPMLENDTHQCTKWTRSLALSVSVIGGGSVALDRGAWRRRPVASILMLLPVFAAAAPIVVVNVVVLASRLPHCWSRHL
jgi:hypothetical protein